MDDVASRAGSLKLLGGRLSLDFANTADWHASEAPVELLTSYSELVAWSVHAGALSDKQGQRILKEAGRQREASARVLERAVALREATYRIFRSVAKADAPCPDDMRTLNEELSRALGQSRIVTKGNGFAWSRSDGEDALDAMLWPVVRDAADLLTSGELARVGQCADGRCGWLFLDTSRNRSRRWCSMDDCGNRAKARRHYQRSRRHTDPGWS